MIKRTLGICTVCLLVLAAGCGKKDDPAASGFTPKPNDFLSSATYTKLTIEIVSVSGFEPSSTSLNNLKAFLESRLNKTVSFSQKTISSPGKSVLSVDDIKSIESNNRTLSTSGTNLTAFFLFADADYSGNTGNSKVLGVAYGASSMTIFEKTIRQFSGGVGQPSISILETTVADHEFGHILGLVNNGTSMQTSHQDAGNGKHCNSQSCLMYFNVETSDAVANLLGGSVPGLDANCLADLKANGGK